MLGNITRILKGTKVVNSDSTYYYTYDDESFDNYKYSYDDYNQLILAKNPNAGTSTSYTYDTSGNITSKTVRAWDPIDNVTSGIIESATYSYNDNSWGDLLTKYNGQTITYDAIGNPKTYRDGITMTWQNGRQLATYSQGNTEVDYTYDVDGLRTSKTVTQNGTTTEYNYVYENGLLLQMTRGSRVYDFIYDGNVLNYK